MTQMPSLLSPLKDDDVFLLSHVMLMLFCVEKTSQVLFQKKERQECNDDQRVWYWGLNHHILSLLSLLGLRNNWSLINSIAVIKCAVTLHSFVICMTTHFLEWLDSYSSFSEFPFLQHVQTPFPCHNSSPYIRLKQLTHTMKHAF